MKSVTVILSVLFISAFSIQAFSESQWELATVEKVTSDTLGVIQIKLDKEAASPCSSKHILLLPYAKGRLNPLLTRVMFAYSTGEKLNITGTGLCHGEFEIVGDISRT